MISKAPDRFHWLQPVAVALVIIGLCLALLLLVRSLADVELTPLLSLPWLPLAVMLQLLASFLFILAWQQWLCLAGNFGFSESAAHIGVTLLGKYIPGKIWGLLGRIFLLQRRNISTQTAVDLLLADQFITFYTGISLGISALLAYFSPGLGVLAVLASAALGLLVFGNYGGLLNWAWCKFSVLLRRFGGEFQPADSRISKHSLGRISIIYSAHWLLTGLVLALLFTPTVETALPGFYLLVIAAIPLAMLAGFLALWAPGGVGVREGIIIAVLSLQIDVELAAVIAICYRLVCVLIDLVVGALAFHFFAGKGAGLLQGGEQAG